MPHLTLLGGAVLEDEDGVVAEISARSHPLALLALLAAAPSNRRSRSELAGYLWPEATERRARGRLNTCLHRVRSVLGREAVASVGDDVRLDPGALECDLWRFREALEDGNPRAAAEGYGGSFLEGFRLRGSASFERWVDGERDRLARAYRDALEELATAAADRGEPAAAARWWRRRVESDPYDSRSVLRLMEALAGSGNRAAALRAAAEHRRRMTEELDAAPNQEVADLADRLRGDSRSEVGEAGADGTDEAAGAPAPEQRGVGAGGRPASQPAYAPPAGAPPVARSRTTVLAAGVVLLAAVAGGAWALMRGGGEVAGEAAVEAAEPTLAVLPFHVLGQGSEDDFDEAIHAGLVTRLARVSGLRVVSGTSVRRYRNADRRLPDIARELGAGWVLEGEVHRLGDRVQVNAQLVNPRTDTHLWAQTYRRDSLTARNAFEIQEDLIRRIVEALEVRLTAEEERRVASLPTENTAAYELYLQADQGRMPASEERLEQRIGLYRRALAMDSTFALAWAGLADALVGRAWSEGWDAAWADSGLRAARRAIELDPDLAEAHAQRGDALWVLEGEEAAERAYRKAIALQPGHQNASNNLGVVLRRRGALAEVARLMDEKRQVEPRSAGLIAGMIGLNDQLGRREVADRWRAVGRELGLSFPEAEFDIALFRDGDLERARSYLDGLPGRPEDRFRLRRRAALALYEGDWRVARRLYRALYPGRSGASDELFRGLLDDRVGLAWSLQRLGQEAEAREVASEVAREARARAGGRRGGGGVRVHRRLTVAELILGDTTAALAQLERAVELGYRQAGVLRTVPTLAPLRDHPRFRRLLARVDSLVAEERRRVEREGWAVPG